MVQQNDRSREKRRSITQRQGGRSILHTIKRSNFNSIDNVLHRNCLVRRINEVQAQGGEGVEEEVRNYLMPSGKRDDTKV